MPKVSFNNKNRVFYSVLKSEVEKYFQEKRLKKTGNWKLFLKSGILIPLAIVIYIFLITVHLPLVFVVVLGGLLGLVLASVGFNVMHDACHGSYSQYKWVNEVFGLSLNMLGGNAFIWKQKHNIIHHTYTNIDGMDDDISFTSLLRLCPTKRWMPIHRLQHIYLFFIYSLTSFAWAFGTDFRKYFSRRVYTTPLSKMNRKEHVVFWTSKFVNIIIYILLPIFLKGWLFGLLFFISVHIILGFTLAIVFQLAHVVENTEFEVAATDPKLIEDEWAVYQVKTTANFAPRNKIVSWFVGGLNYQIEHHLFPRISHVHYPALARIVKKACIKFNIPYNENPTMTSAITSHIRMMKLLGKKPTLAGITE
jgi:linoleoyl-CoA desaturase